MKPRAERTKPDRRSRKRLTVRFGPGPPAHIGYTGNISRSGMMIRSTRVFAPGTRLNVEFELPSGTFRLSALVIWARGGEVRWLPSGRIGMGLKFLDVPENVMDIIFPIALPG
jgi:PilZ domain